MGEISIVSPTKPRGCLSDVQEKNFYPKQKLGFLYPASKNKLFLTGKIYFFPDLRDSVCSIVVLENSI